ncbi:beta-amyrin 16-alpha-hydroxylase CYP87D16-like [Mercurialis annua]|uniref:beta-amyrin 16-alpha-hydroxylase CYP87D16-like n=1 Tax=Mercurialis annua TaxID=3986 RepID=UPI00215E0E9D|nr:beta-amyrin 16-alpha-hydroxylase CYP87D16-like [Mercurialis annua]
MNMWLMSISVFAFAIILSYVAHWIFRWRNPACNGRLPPGSMGFPLIGETIQFFIPSKSLDMPRFVKSRIKKYGSIFKTSLAGRPLVVSSDDDFNHFILQQEGKLVELWYLDSYSELLGQNDPFKDGINFGHIYKTFKRLITEHFGPERLKEYILPQLEGVVDDYLQAWSEQGSVDLRHCCRRVILDFTSKLLFTYDTEKNGESLNNTFMNFTKGLLSFPVNIPGTTFHKCLESKNNILKMIKETLEKRKAFPETRKGDFLDSLIQQMEADKLFTDDLVSYLIFALLLATSETLPTSLTLAIKLLSEHPLVMEELLKENEEIIRSRENKESAGLTWKEYKSMTFTTNVINEVLRMSGSAGMFRRTLADIYINGYTIPKGWTILIVPASIHFNPNNYKDPTAFNPWRWKDLGSDEVSKSYIPFGRGMRPCGGSDYSKVFIAVFIHVILTKYRYSTVKTGEIVRTPMLQFGNGHFIKVSKKQEMNEEGN